VVTIEATSETEGKLSVLLVLRYYCYKASSFKVEHSDVRMPVLRHVRYLPKLIFILMVASITVEIKPIAE